MQEETANRKPAARRPHHLRAKVVATALLGASVVMMPAVSHAGVLGMIDSMHLTSVVKNVGEGVVNAAIYSKLNPNGAMGYSRMDQLGVTGAIERGADNAVGQVVDSVSHGVSRAVDPGAPTTQEPSTSGAGIVLPPATQYVP